MSATIRCAALCALLPLAACSSLSYDHEVKLYLPVSRLELPIISERFVNGAIATTADASLQLTEDQVTTTPDPQAPKIDAESNGMLRMETRISGPLAIGARVFGNGAYAGTVKLASPFGIERGGLAVAGTWTHGRNEDDFSYNAQSALTSHTGYQQRWNDFGLVLGTGLGERWMLFGGPFYSRHRYSGDYHSERGDDPDVNQHFDGRATLRGANLGLAFRLPSQHMIVEVSYAQVDAGRSEDDILRVSGGYQFSFGPRTVPRVKPQPARREPARVVPPVE